MTIDQSQQPQNEGTALVHSERMPPAEQRTGRADLVFTERVLPPEPKSGDEPISN